MLDQVSWQALPAPKILVPGSLVRDQLLAPRRRTARYQIEECWIKYPRKYYQRQKCWCPAVWFETSCLLPVDGQLDTRQKNAGSRSVLAGIIRVSRTQLSVQRSVRSKSRSFGNIHANFPSTPWGKSVFAMLIEAPTLFFEPILDFALRPGEGWNPTAAIPTLEIQCLSHLVLHVLLPSESKLTVRGSLVRDQLLLVDGQLDTR